MQKSMSLKHEPSSEPLHISAQQMFSKEEKRYREAVDARLDVGGGAVLVAC